MFPIKINIVNGGVTATKDGNTKFILPACNSAVVRNIQLIDGHLVIVRWENLETIIYVFLCSSLNSVPSRTRLSGCHPLSVSVSSSGKKLIIEDPATSPKYLDVSLDSLPAEISVSSQLQIVRTQEGIPIHLALPECVKTLASVKKRLLVSVYAGFGVCLPMQYDPNVSDWVKQGGIWAQIFARGGGELGSVWQREGKGAGSLVGARDILSALKYLQSYGSFASVSAYGFSHGASQLLRAFFLRPLTFDRLALWSPAVELCSDWGRWPELWFGEYGNPGNPCDRELMMKACPTEMLKKHSLEQIKHDSKRRILILSSRDDNRVNPDLIKEFSSGLSSCWPVDFHEASHSGHAGTGNNSQSEEQLELMWSFLRS